MPNPGRAVALPAPAGHLRRSGETQMATMTARSEGATFLPLLAVPGRRHFLNDLIQSLIPTIYPILKAEFALDLGQSGMITLTFQIAGSLFQPLVGLFPTSTRCPVPRRREWDLTGGRHGAGRCARLHDDPGLGGLPRHRRVDLPSGSHADGTLCRAGRAGLARPGHPASGMSVSSTW